VAGGTTTWRLNVVNFCVDLREEASATMTIHIRQAVSADLPVLRTLIDASVRGLQTKDYTTSQIESALATVYGVDTQLIADETYFVAEAKSNGDETVPVIVGCGGWSKRKTLYGGDQWTGREAACSTRNTTPPKFVPSSSIRPGPDAVLAP
jgi:hypothetical protein